MGNNSTKETYRDSPHHHHAHHRHNSSTSSNSGAPLSRAGDNNGDGPPAGPVNPFGHYSRSRGSSRNNLDSSTFLGFASDADRFARSSSRGLVDPGGGVGTMEDAARPPRDGKTKEQRKKEKEQERERERLKSMAEESVDGGFLVTQGVYTGVQDFKIKVVRQLQIERRLSPFYKGLSDHEPNWTDSQLVATVRGFPMPSPAAVEITNPMDAQIVAAAEDAAIQSNLHLTVPIAARSRAQSYTSETSSSSIKGTPVTGRARSKTVSTTKPHEGLNSKTINGRPIEAVLYQSAVECPICFLYYPPWINRTRCCDQEICSECFVQIKRKDPHIPEQQSPPSSPIQSSSTLGGQSELISEPAACPFCKEPELGVVYSPPPFRRGLVTTSTSAFGQGTSALAAAFSGRKDSANSSRTSLVGMGGSSTPTSPPLSPSSITGTRRKTSLPTSAPEVVTTDRIRPDWAQRLATARAHQARRAAAATALHTAAYLMGSMDQSSRERGSGLPRMIRMRGVPIYRPGDSPGGSGAGTPTSASAPGTSDGGRTFSPGRSPGGLPQGALATLAGMAERHAVATAHREAAQATLAGAPITDRGGDPGHASEGINSTPRLDMPPPPRPGLEGLQAPNPAAERRRTRIMDLEEMMIAEAIRQSLAEEEARKKKEAKKKAREPDPGHDPTQVRFTPEVLGKGKAPESNHLGTVESGAFSIPSITSFSADGSHLSQSLPQHSQITAVQDGESGTRPRAGSTRSISSDSTSSSFPDSSVPNSGFQTPSPNASGVDFGHGEGRHVVNTSGDLPRGEEMFNFRSLVGMVERNQTPPIEPKDGEPTNEKPPPPPPYVTVPTTVSPGSMNSGSLANSPKVSSPLVYSESVGASTPAAGITLDKDVEQNSGGDTLHIPQEGDPTVTLDPITSLPPDGEASPASSSLAASPLEEITASSSKATTILPEASPDKTADETLGVPSLTITPSDDRKLSAANITIHEEDKPAEHRAERVLPAGTLG